MEVEAYTCGLKPPAMPADCHVGPPDFVGIGAQKAGTTWWYSLLHRHPQIYHPKYMQESLELPYLRKEWYSFDRFFQDEFTDSCVADYHDWFPRPEGMVTGEWMPDYLAQYWTPPLLKHAAPHTKLLVILRDPVERFISGMAHLLRGLYWKQLQLWFKWFSRDNILILQYETLQEHPQAQLRRTYEFLGVDTAFLPEPKKFTKKRNSMRPGTEFSLTRDQRKALIDAYSDDVTLLGQHISAIDLSGPILLLTREIGET